ncbi:hypothetical protein HDU98_011496 [Podochytrium sp. JEL0797]|nr:hypothetical protein HDU98_011496 [Podochytrium sp. JEL0797]
MQGAMQDSESAELASLHEDLRLLMDLEAQMDQLIDSNEPTADISAPPESHSSESEAESDTDPSTLFNPFDPTVSLLVSHTQADWRSFSNGVAERYLHRMGHKSGEGLGKSEGGIVDPIEAVVLPAGKGLGFDVSSESTRKPKRMRENEATGDLGTRNMRREDTEEDLFGFLNRSLNPGMMRGKPLDEPAAASTTKRASPPSSSSKPQKDVQDRASLLRLHNRCTTIQSEVSKTQHALIAASRRKPRDSVKIGHLTAKLAFLKSKLDASAAEEDRVSARLHRGRVQEKMVSF